MEVQFKTDRAGFPSLTNAPVRPCISAFFPTTKPAAKCGKAIQRLKFLVKEAGLSASDLGRLLGNRGMESLYLTGKRGLSKANIRKLARHFNVRADYFL